jgi:ribonucleotide reductase alpha subunit
MSIYVYKPLTVLNKPHIKRLLIERYLYPLSKEVIQQLPGTLYYKVNVSEIPDFDYMSYGIVPSDDGVIYFESWKALTRRVGRRIALGILFSAIDKDNEKYVSDTTLLKSLRLEYNEWLETNTFKKPPHTLLWLLNEAKQFESYISNLNFIPSSPFLFNAFRYYVDNPDVMKLVYDDGLESLLKLSTYYVNKDGEMFVSDPGYGSCYSMGSIGDSTKDIYDMLYMQAEIFRNAGGFGVNFSKLRSKHAFVKTIKGRSSGAVSFMDLYNQTTELIALSSRLKRGANMFILSVYHPEIEEFINVKTDVEKGYEKLKYANISVAVDNKFLDKVFNNEEYETVDPHDPNIRFTKRARKIWTNIILNSTLHAEPGILNFDNINKDYIVNEYDTITSTNPCSEYVSRDKSVCVLGSVNLYSFLYFDENDEIKFDYNKLKQVTHSLHRFLTYANFANKHVLPILTHNTRLMRNTGIGYMGLASTLIALKIRYGSVESKKFFETIMKSMNESVFQSTVQISKEIGPFPEFKDVINILEDKIIKYGLDEGKSGTVFTGAYWKKHLFVPSEYNSTIDDNNIYFAFNISNPYTYYYIGKYDVNTQKVIIENPIANMRFFAIAPTGSISYIANVSSGIEPIFSLAYVRTINKGMPTEYSVVITDYAIDTYLRYHKQYTDSKIDETLKLLASGEQLKFDDYVVTNHEVGIERLNLLNVSNSYIDMNTSVTFNIMQKQSFDEFMRGLDMLDIDEYQKEQVKQTKEFLNTFDMREEIINILNENDYIRRIVATYIAKWFSQSEDEQEDVYKTIWKKEYNIPEFEKFVSLVKLVNAFYVMSSYLGMKGVTVYVENSRSPVLQVVKKENKNKPLKLDFTMKLEGTNVLEDKTNFETISLESKNLKVKRTSKGYLVTEDGKKICPVCHSELHLEEGCIKCHSCGWSACV